jgi:hypothetical protein
MTSYQNVGKYCVKVCNELKWLRLVELDGSSEPDNSYLHLILKNGGRDNFLTIKPIIS